GGGGPAPGRLPDGRTRLAGPAPARDVGRGGVPRPRGSLTAPPGPPEGGAGRAPRGRIAVRPVQGGTHAPTVRPLRRSEPGLCAPSAVRPLVRPGERGGGVPHGDGPGAAPPARRTVRPGARGGRRQRPELRALSGHRRRGGGHRTGAPAAFPRRGVGAARPGAGGRGTGSGGGPAGQERGVRRGG